MTNIHLKRGLETGVVAGITAAAILGLSQYTKFFAVFLDVTLFHIYLGHFAVSILLGVIFSYTFGKKIGSHERSLFSGLAFGLIIWVVVSAILWSSSYVIREAGFMSLVPLLWMHLMYGFITGLVYDIIVPDSEQEAISEKNKI